MKAHIPVSISAPNFGSTDLTYVQVLDLLLDSAYEKTLMWMMTATLTYFLVRFCHMVVRRWQRSRYADLRSKNSLARFLERIWVACVMWNWYHISPIPTGSPARIRVVRRNGYSVREEYYTHMAYTFRTQGRNGPLIDCKTPYPKRLLGWDLKSRLWTRQLLTSDDRRAQGLFREAHIAFPSGTYDRKRRFRSTANWWPWHRAIKN